MTILEIACNMELPNGGEAWQQLRQGYLPPEFTAGEWGQGGGRSVCHICPRRDPSSQSASEAGRLRWLWKLEGSREIVGD